jgi:hypothetical protein
MKEVGQESCVMIASVVEHDDHAPSGRLLAKQAPEESPNVAALKIGHIIRTNCPVSKLTAPKQATDFRVGACRRIGSLISGGTHMRQREPCCWK